MIAASLLFPESLLFHPVVFPTNCAVLVEGPDIALVKRALVKRQDAPWPAGPAGEGAGTLNRLMFPYCYYHGIDF